MERVYKLTAKDIHDIFAGWANLVASGECERSAQNPHDDVQGQTEYFVQQAEVRGL